MAVWQDSVWLITGASSGFGRALVAAVLAEGGRVAATARDTRSIADFAEGAGDRVLILPLDVTNAGQAAAAVAAAQKRFGDIDVLVNAAGYGFVGSIEEATDPEIQALFAVNLFGPVRLIRAVLPGMRKRKRGFIINFSSLAGVRAIGGTGHYAATKFAVEGMSEALYQEVKPLGIGVMIVEPGAFRTDYAKTYLAYAANTIEDYAATSGKLRTSITARDGAQPGDPVRGAHAILDAIRSPSPPLRLALGRQAADLLQQTFRERLGELEAWRSFAESADYPPDSA